MEGYYESILEFTPKILKNAKKVISGPTAERVLNGTNLIVVAGGALIAAAAVIGLAFEENSKKA